MSEGVAKAASDTIAAHNTASARIAALDERFHRERNPHEADNAKNRAAIADGTRRLRIAIAKTTSGGTAPATGTAAGGMGDGAGRYAELSPAVGAALFEIVDDADGDARMKATYLQHYMLMLQRRGDHASISHTALFHKAQIGGVAFSVGFSSKGCPY
ncbi:lysis system i-spanin subunit Rz [Caballeronia sp. LZ001]|uniref:lysis system i-spanin subunit Rz n=1 Tax=Caballeronia sp. LZ001 TaxID=3038553 RepID=UPI0038D3C186